MNSLIKIPYSSTDIRNFYTYEFEWIDELSFILPARNHTENAEELVVEIQKIFKSRGWQGDGEIGLIWIPPFALAKIVKGGSDKFLEKFPLTTSTSEALIARYSWTHGLVLWHVKQQEDGTSFLCSPLELDIPSYGLDEL